MVTMDVIIPIHNTVNYLRKCIDSILSQKIDNLHIILVDDGSDDGSEEICDEYTKAYNNVITIHQHNKGEMQALSAGIEQTSSDYVTVVDSDDWIEDGTYASLLQFMACDIDVICYPIIRYFSENFFYVDHTSDFIGKYEEVDIKTKVFSNMIWDLNNKRPGLDQSLCNKVFRRELLLEFINKASHLAGNYGQDAAILYPMMKKVKTMVSSEHGKYYHRQRLSHVIPPYLSTPEFARHLLDLYEYLYGEYIEYEDVRKQIDYFYVESSKLRLRVYGEDVSHRYYLFPFSQVPNKSNVIIYGAGRIGHMYVEQINKTEYCTLLAWVDRNVEKSQNGLKIIKPESITESKPDAVVIAIYDRHTAEDVRKDLMSYGIDKEKIIWEMNCIKI